MMKYILLVAALVAAQSANADNSTKRPSSQIAKVGIANNRLLTCGATNTEPTAAMWDKKDLEPRACGATHNRQYKPKYRGVGFDILNYESEACFVPDQSFRLLDTIVGKVVQRVRSAKKTDEHQKILLTSKATSDVLTEMGFALWIPTKNLSDTMHVRRTASDKFRNLFDCDVGSMILLTVAENLDMKASLVETTISEPQAKEVVQHNFVRWHLKDGKSINWDMNFKDECETPTKNQLPYQGKNLSTQQFWAYETSLRGGIWEKAERPSEAVKDYLSAMRAFPERPGAYNGFAWIVATKILPERTGYRADALSAALKAIEIRNEPNVLDTLACAYAYNGDFVKAIETQNTAIERAPAKHLEDFKRRLALFSAATPRDCTGEE